MFLAYVPRYAGLLAALFGFVEVAGPEEQLVVRRPEAMKARQISVSPT